MRTCSAGLQQIIALREAVSRVIAKKGAALPFQLILFNYFFAIFLRTADLPACTDAEVDSGIMPDKDTIRARRRFRSCQNARVHRVRARDCGWLCAVAVKAECGTGDRR
jgi:hypothetical protein